MRISRNLVDFNSTINGNIGVIIGNFDGVHLGHNYLISNFVKYCTNKNITPCLITFLPHPHIFLNKTCSSFLITKNQSKFEFINKLGIKCVFQIDFDKEVQEQSSQEFIQKYILSIKLLSLIYLGHDFKMGKGKRNSIQVLIESVKSSKIEIVQEKPFYVNDKIVSSSKIRNLIQQDINSVEELLGRKFEIEGIVTTGAGRGKKIGFATVNIDIEPSLIIPDLGVYITSVYINGTWYESITNIGINPSFEGASALKIESHIFYFKDEIYGSKITIKFIDFIRNEKKFEKLNLLVSQIEKDIIIAKNHFRENNGLKFALIGKNISHSKSQLIYEVLLKKSIHYDLIDCISESAIPCVEELRMKYYGVSITSPYKRFFLNKVDKLSPPDIKSINMLKFTDNKIIAFNTDQLAISEILEKFYAGGVRCYIILGDGAMADLVTRYLNDNNQKYSQFSRKKDNLSSIQEVLKKLDGNTLVVNCCAREYICKYSGSGSYIFWNMNYDHPEQELEYKNTTVSYHDGHKQLKLQAKYALNIWNIEPL